MGQGPYPPRRGQTPALLRSHLLPPDTQTPGIGQRVRLPALCASPPACVLAHSQTLRRISAGIPSDWIRRLPLPACCACCGSRPGCCASLLGSGGELAAGDET
jgi:hypothetical protein